MTYMYCRCYEIYCTEDKICFVKYETALQDICRENVGKIANTKLKSLPDIMLITWKNFQATASFVENYFLHFLTNFGRIYGTCYLLQKKFAFQNLLQIPTILIYLFLYMFIAHTCMFQQQKRKGLKISTCNCQLVTVNVSMQLMNAVLYS